MRQPWRAGLLIAVVARLGAQEPKPLGLEAKDLKAQFTSLTTRFVISPDGARIAATVRNGSRATLNVDGQTLAEVYDELGGFPASSENRVIVPVIFSPDGSRYAFVGSQSSQFRVIVDGKPNPGAQFVDSFRFSADSKRYAYAAPTMGSDGKPEMFKRPQDPPDGGTPGFRVVADGVPSPVYSSVDSLQFSRDGQRLGYVGGLGGNYVAAVDGKPDAPCWKIAGFSFSPDGKHWSYTCRMVGADPNVQLFHVVVDGKRSAKGYTEVQHLQWSETGGHYGFVGNWPTPGPAQTPNWEAVVDGRVVSAGIQAAAGRMILGLRLSPDGLRHGFLVGQGKNGRGKELAVVDGKASLEYEGLTQPVFSPDSKHFVALASQNGASFAWFDGEEVEMPGQSNWRTPADSFFQRLGGKYYFYPRKLGGEWKLVLEGGGGEPVAAALSFARGPMVRDPRGIVGNHDGTMLFDTNDSTDIQIGGKKLASVRRDDFATASGLPKRHFVFSPDGKYVAFVGVSREPPLSSVYLNDSGLPGDGWYALPVFSADSRHFAYAERKRLAEPGKAEVWSIVVDGSPAVEVDDPLVEAPHGFAFQPNGQLRFFAVQGGQVKQFTVTPKGTVDDYAANAAKAKTKQQIQSALPGGAGQPASAASNPQQTAQEAITKPLEAAKDKLKKGLGGLFGGKKK